MKELIVRFSDDAASYISSAARMMGLTSEELVKYVIGRWIRSDKMDNPVLVGVQSMISTAESSFRKHARKAMISVLKERAKSGELKCRNCTLPLKPEDIDSGKCSSCGADIFSKEEKGGSLDDNLPWGEI